MAHVIFALDEDTRALDRSAAVALIEGNGGKSLIGCYSHEDGRKITEPSYILHEDAFRRLNNGGLLPVGGQESFLKVSECNKQYAWLVWNHEERDNTYLGCLTCVSMEKAMEAPSWTFDPQLNRWFITTDNSQAAAPHEEDQIELWAAIDRVLLIAGKHTGDRALMQLRKCRDKMKPKWIKS